VEVCALSLTVVAALTAILLSDWILREKIKAQEIESAGMPFRIASSPDFFVASSNGPDFLRNWREEDLFAVLKSQGEAAAENYLVTRRYDPSNGTASAGDYIIYARSPEPPLTIDPFPQKIQRQWAAVQDEGAEDRP